MGEKSTPFPPKKNQDSWLRNRDDLYVPILYIICRFLGLRIPPPKKLAYCQPVILGLGGRSNPGAQASGMGSDQT